MDLEEIKYWNAFNLISEIGPVRFRKIMNYFPCFKEAYSAGEEELSKSGLEDRVINNIIVSRPEIDLDREMDKLAKEQIHVVTFRDKSYPSLLKEIYTPSPILYAKGDLNNAVEDRVCVAIVGTRKPSLYGKQTAVEFAEALSKMGITIVSGLAKGIDTLVHQVCVKNQTPTIAVLGSGIDEQSIYPYSNRKLAKEIVNAGGAVVSEYPFGTLPLKQNFPARNRIISGLSIGVLVVEAPQNSGALITAKHALDQNREIFAIPGPINSANSEGTNQLIKSGAKLVTNINDIIDELNLSPRSPLSDSVVGENLVQSDNNEEEMKILRLLSREPLHIDFIIKNSNLTISQTNSLLTVLEIKGKIKNLGGMNYVLIN